MVKKFNMVIDQSTVEANVGAYKLVGHTRRASPTWVEVIPLSRRDGNSKFLLPNLYIRSCRSFTTMRLASGLYELVPLEPGMVDCLTSHV